MLIFNDGVFASDLLRKIMLRSDFQVLFSFLVLASQTTLLRADGPQLYNPTDRAQALTRQESFYDLPTFRPAGSTTRVRLDVRYAENRFNEVHLKHRSYNGGLVGPVIRARPGSSLKIRLSNNLPNEINSGEHDPNIPHAFNTTNLHTHGLHVSPLGKSDNVFLSIPPGSHEDYEIQVPATHPAGTFWYHALKHGSVALQLSSGMAGALIVEGGLDNAPVIREMREQILVLQQFTYRLVPGEPAIIHPDDIYSENSTATPVTAVNGQVTPASVMQPGEIQRWRVIHAGIEDPIKLTADVPLKMYAVAFDGLATGAISELTEDDAMLNPGYRLDVLVQVPRNAAEGSAYLLSTEIVDSKKSFRNRTVKNTALIKVVVQGPPKDMTLPKAEDLASYAAFKDGDVPTDAEVGPVAYRVELQNGNDPMNKPYYRVNGAPYDPAVVSHTMRLGTAEEWRLKGAGKHPFHIHVNPFAVKLPPGLDGKPRWLWRDTLLVSDTETTIRTRFSDYCGKFVLHCHILGHEDQGMMQNVEIIDGPMAQCVQATGAESAKDRRSGPSWVLKDPDGRTFAGADLRGEKTLLVFHRGLSCLHCAQQLLSIAERRKDFLREGVKIVGISPSLPPENELQKLRVENNLAFTLLADPEQKVFAAHGCLSSDDEVLHGIFLIDRQGTIIWSNVSETPFTDLDRIMRIAREATAGQ